MNTTPGPSETTQPVSLKDRLPAGRDPRPEELEWIPPAKRATTKIIDAQYDPKTDKEILPYTYTGPKSPRIPEGSVQVYTEDVPLEDVLVHVVGVTGDKQPISYYHGIAAGRIAYCASESGAPAIVVSDENVDDVVIELPGEDGKELMSGLQEIGAMQKSAMLKGNLFLANSLNAAQKDIVRRVGPVNSAREVLSQGMPAKSAPLKAAA